MSLMDRLSLKEDGLTTSERRVASVLLRDPQEVQFLSAAEVAERSSVHESSVIRMAQKLGYKGFAALRADIRAEASNVDVAARARRREEESYELARYVKDEASALLRLGEMVPQEQINEISEVLIGARKIYLYGSALLVDCMEKRLRRVGLEPVRLPDYGRDLPELAASMTEGDVLFSFVLREPHGPLAPLARHARTVGATIVVVTDEPGIQLSPKPDHTVTALRGADDNFRTMVTTIALCYAFELAIYHLAEAQAAAALDKVTRLNAVFNASYGELNGTEA